MAGWKIVTTGLTFKILIGAAIISCVGYLLYFNSSKDKEYAVVKHSFRSECGPLVLAFPAGPLGYQMFQYASLLAIAEHNNRTPVLEVTVASTYKSLYAVFKTEQLATIKLTESEWENTLEIQETAFNVFDDRMFNIPCDTEIVRICCYFYSYRYFDEFDEIIRKNFQFKSEIAAQAENKLQKILSENNIEQGGDTALVGFHSKTQASTSCQIQDATYVVRATHFLERHFRNHRSINILGMGDEPTYITSVKDYEDAVSKGGVDGDGSSVTAPTLKEILPNVIELWTSAKNAKNLTAVDLCMLTLCDANIVTAGPLSFWTGYINPTMSVYKHRAFERNCSEMIDRIPTYFSQI